jgi:hypothetical protein
VTDPAHLLEALRAVPGVASAELEPDDRPEGAGTLRLQLSPGADEVQVATSVNRVLREQFGLAVDANRVQVVEEAEPLRRAESEPTLPALPTAPTPGSHPAGTGSAATGSEADAEDDTPLTPPTPIRRELRPVPDPVEPVGSAWEEVRASLDEAATRGVTSPVAPGAAAPTASGDAATHVPGSPVLLPPPVGTTTALENDVRAPGHGAAPMPLLSRPPRVLIQRMQLVSAGLGVTTQVTLSWQGSPFSGEADAAATPTSVHRSVAMATLRAVEAVVSGQARFELEQLEVNQLGPDRAVVVVVAMLTSAGSERLTGVSVVREDVRQAVIRATLDALNRRLESMLLG